MKKFVYMLIFLTLSIFAFSGTAFAQNGEPQKVTGLTFTKGEQDTVSFCWNKTQKADVYYVYMLEEDTGKYKLVKAVRDNETVIDSLESGKSYVFRVVAVNFESGQKYVGEASDSLSTVTAPKGDLVLKTSAITESSITLNWNRIADATGYKVYRYDEEKGKYVSCGKTTKTSKKIKNLEKDTEYTFKVKAYTKTDGALAYGIASDKYTEFTHTDGYPHTASQAAKVYNGFINALKKEQNFTVEYTKTIDTELLSCDKKNLSLTVENTINLFKGTLNKTYKFSGGKSGNITPDMLFEPYSQNATVIRDDIESIEFKNIKNGYKVTMVLKSDSGDNLSGSYCESAVSYPDIKALNIMPLKVKTADTYYDRVKIIFAVKKDKLRTVKIEGAALSDVHFSVSTVEANTLIGYSLYEEYNIKY